MAIKADDSVTVPKSTGAVKTPTEPVTSEQVASNESTGAVEHVAPGTTTVDHQWGTDVQFPTPTEPVVMSTGWMSDGVATTKVVGAPSKAAPKKAGVKSETA